MVAPGLLAEARRRCAARAGSARSHDCDSRWSTRSVRTTRCGRAVDLGRHHGARHRRAEVERLDGVGHPALGREQEAGAHGHAGGAVGQGGHQAAPVVEAAGPEDEHAVAHGLDDLGQQQRRGHGAGVAAALAALGDDGVDAPLGHLLGVAAGADGGHDEQPGLLAAGDQGRVGRLGEAGHPGAGLDHELDALVHVGHVGAQVDAEGAVVRLRTSAMAAASSSRVMVAEARMPSPPASRGGGDQAGPGHPAHAGLHQRVAHADPLAQRGVQRRVQRRSAGAGAGVGAGAQLRTSRSRSEPGSSTTRMSSSSSGVGRRVSATSSGTVSAKPVAATMSSTRDAGVVRAQAHGAVGRLEVEHAEVRDDAADVVEARGAGAGRGGPGVADAADDVDLLHEGAHGVVGHPVAGRVVDRVARRAAHADQLHLGLGVRADGRDVLVARAVDLARHHHHVAPARPHHVEDGAVGHGRLADQLGRAGGDGRRADHQRRLAVGEHDVGREGELGQPGAEGGDGAERAGHDLARLAPGVGAGDDAGLGPGHAGVAHAVTLLAAPPRGPGTRRRSTKT